MRSTIIGQEAAVSITLTREQADTVYRCVHPPDITPHETWREWNEHHVRMWEQTGDSESARWQRDEAELLDQLERQRKQPTVSLALSPERLSGLASALLEVGELSGESIAARAEEVARYTVGLALAREAQR